MKLNIVSLIPRAQSLKNASTYPALPYMYIHYSFDLENRIIYFEKVYYNLCIK